MTTLKHSRVVLGLTLFISLCAASTGCSSDRAPGEADPATGVDEASLVVERFDRETSGQGDNDADSNIAATMVYHPSAPVFVTAAQRVDGFLGVSAFYSNQTGLAPQEYTSITAIGADVDVARVGHNARVVVAVTTPTGELVLIQYKVDAGTNQRQLSRMFHYSTAVQTSSSRKVEIESVRFETGPIVMTSVIDSNGALRLDTWKVSDTEIVHLDTAWGLTAATDVVLAGDFDNNTAATATFNSTGGVQLDLWATDWAGTITSKPGSSRSIGTATQVAISLQDTRLNVAHRTSSALTLRAYDASFSSTGFINPVDTYALSATNRVAIDDHAGRMIVAVKSGTGNLKLIAFHRENGIITRITDNELDNAPAGSVTLFDLVSNDDLLFTGSNGGTSLDVKGITWSYYH